MPRRRSMADWCAIFLGATCSVIPYGAKSKTIPAEMCGKVPGWLNKRTGLWVGTTGAIPGRFMTPEEAAQADKDGASVGLLGEHFPCGDFDVEDAELAGCLIALAVKMLGPAPIRRREGSTRAALMFSGTNIRKRVISWGGDKENNIKPNQIEILGRGQYWNVDGRHPSGNWYVWDEPHPCDLGPYNLSEITQDQVNEFILAAVALLRERGIEATVLGGKAREGLSDAARTSLDNASLHAPSPQAVLDLLACYRPDVLGHDDFVQHMVAIKAALGPDREDYYPNVLEWSPGIRSTEYEATRKRWDSIHDASIGWDWLCKKAGYADFDDPPDDMLPPDPGTTELQKIAARWVFDCSNGLFHDRVNRVDATKDVFNAIHTRLSPYAVAARATAAALCINFPAFVKVDERIYAPGQPVLFHENGKSMLNLWRPSSLEPMPGDPHPWLILVERLFPDPSAREHFLNFIAFILQNPGVKIGHGILLHSRLQGVGKGTVLTPLELGVGMENISTIEPDDLIGPFNHFLRAQLIICNEMANFERKAVYNRLKSYLEKSTTPLYIRELYTKPYPVKNNQNWIFTSNYNNAVPLEIGDRRFWVYEIVAPPMNPEEAKQIHAWLKAGGAAFVVHWLLLRDLSNFDANATPPMTKAKEEMIEQAIPLPIRWLNAQEGFKKREFLTAGEIADAAQYGADREVSVSIRPWHITTWLKANGFVSHPHRVRIEGGDPTTVWTRDTRPETMAATGEFLAARIIADRKKR